MAGRRTTAGASVAFEATTVRFTRISRCAAADVNRPTRQRREESFFSILFARDRRARRSFSPRANVLNIFRSAFTADVQLPLTMSKIISSRLAALGSDAMKSPFHRSVLALAAVGVLAGASLANAQQKSDSARPLKKYESGTKDFWTHPPDDWFLGDETEAQKG